MTTMASFPIRLVLEGNLRMLGAFASAGTEVKSDSDATILKDGEGRILLSGTGLKGQLRAVMSRVLGEKNVQELFGRQDSVSRLSVEDSSVRGNAAKRHRVSIRRDRGTAAAGLLFDQEVTGPGTRFPVRIVLRTNRDLLENDRLALSWIKTLLEFGAITPGGDSRRGLGHCVLEQGTCSEYDRAEEAQLSAWLAGVPTSSRSMLNASSLRPIKGTAFRVMAVDLELEFEDGILVGGGEKSNVDGESDLLAYRMLAADGKERIVLPGGGLRGVLRQKVEQLWRLRNAKNVCDPTEEGGWCHASRRKDGAKDDGSDLCPVCQLFGAVGWRSPLSISDFVEVGDRVHEQIIDHVAINRFTGGAEESKKFDEQPVFHGRFFGRILLENPRLQQLAVLAHLGLSAHDGELWFGHSTHRGIGRLTKVSVQKLSLLQSDSWDDGVPAPFSQPVALVNQEKGSFNWNDWLKTLQPVFEHIGE